MTSMSAACRLTILLLAILTWNGCNPMTGVDQDEEKNPHYMAGKSRLNSMDYKGAIEAFEKAIEANPHSASAHFELGLLYYQRMNDHATAIYHYQKHLKLQPKSNLADTARQHIELCKVEIAKTVPFSLVNQQVHAGIDRLTTENAVLRQQIEHMKGQLSRQAAQLTNRPPTLPNPPAAEQAAGVTNRSVVTPERPPLAASVPAGRTMPGSTTKVHVVKRGDTLASIAREEGVPPAKLPAAIAKLQAANPGLEPRQMKVGQTVKVPLPLY